MIFTKCGKILCVKWEGTSECLWKPSVKSFEYDGLAALNLTKWEYCLDLDNELEQVQVMSEFK